MAASGLRTRGATAAPLRKPRRVISPMMCSYFSVDLPAAAGGTPAAVPRCSEGEEWHVLHTVWAGFFSWQEIHTPIVVTLVLSYIAGISCTGPWQFWHFRPDAKWTRCPHFTTGITL